MCSCKQLWSTQGQLYWLVISQLALGRQNRPQEVQI